MELFLGMDEEPTESLWVRIKEKTTMSDISVDVCYRPPDQEEHMDEALYRQIGVVAHSQALVLMGDFNHPNICWRDNTVGHKQSRKFLECIDDNFLLQVIEEPMRRDVLLHLLLTNKENWNWEYECQRQPWLKYHEMVELRILRGGRRVKGKFITLDLYRGFTPAGN
ncbi:hypothetical protein GRJ2_003163900 [Grus japonensis]|uniref:Dtw domain-containing protein 2 n=1 Tax=Grus japonensis TaxID=30415 RepID=A0ABC9YAG8_GRUJA